ncbi:MAG: flavin reductase [Bacteroidales bacterium]|nr:flavin reductase [Bacteroidales bacterium]
MKIRMRFLCAAVALFVLAGCGDNRNQNNDKQDMAMNSELKPFDVQKEFTDNGFSFFTKNLILCCGDSTESNAMTIGWGGIGNYLGHDRPAVTVYVAPARYTYEFMERYPRFTVMEFEDPMVWMFMGENSGRDFKGNDAGIEAQKDKKAAALGLHIAYTEHGTPYYKEAKTVIECETMTSWHQTEKDFRNDTPKKWYDGFEAGVHTVYIGEVLGAWKK